MIKPIEIPETENYSARRQVSKQPLNPGFDGRTWLEAASELCGVDNGVSTEMDGFKFSKSKHRKERIKALGNAIVPAIALEIFIAIIYSNEILAG